LRCLSATPPRRHPLPRLLFILKHRDAPWGSPYGYGGPYHLSSGLRNSVRFVVELLDLLGIPAKMVEVIDNNAIDAEVTRYQPTHCIIEALWVVPDKFDVLKRLHPHVSWIVRNHSEVPFLANEGIAMAWFAGYLQRGVEIACNSERMLSDMKIVGQAVGVPNLISYMPNYYPVHLAPDVDHLQPHLPHADDTIRIGCFGAIRPLKNHLSQALAALQYSHRIGKKLEFYINASRIEGGGNQILNNLRGLFAATPRARLVEQGWLDHEKFLELLEQMDLCLQVSFTETFNIVSADAVFCSVPVVVSSEVSWMGNYAVADPNSVHDIVQRMLAITPNNRANWLMSQWRDLSLYGAHARKIWFDRFGFGAPMFAERGNRARAMAGAMSPRHFALSTHRR
jgi:glycosyltransferase involved in cell wall biosynthesis